MPLPSPNESESQSDFVERCMSEISNEFNSNKQRVAVCNAQWRRNKKGQKMTNQIETEADLHEDQEGVSQYHEFVKAEEHPDYTFVLGPVLVPEEVDKQGDIVSIDEIEKAAHGYIEDSQRPGLMHALMLGSRDAKVVESYVAREDTLVNGVSVKKGTWMLGMRVYAKKLRKLIKEGTLGGYSIGGRGRATAE